MTTTKLMVEVTPWFDEEGVFTSLYIGDACEPVYEGHTPYKELVDLELSSYTINGKIPEKHLDEVEEFVRTLEELGDYARKQMEKLSNV